MSTTTSDFTAILTDAWLHYPVTAGGLGLQHALIFEAAYREGFEKRREIKSPETRPVDWQREYNDWTNFYDSMLQVFPRPPKSTPVKEALVKDFISRGSDLTQGNQKSLSNYWTWVLYIYGPQILEQFGTFRFLILEPVPSKLISQQYIDSTSV